MILVEKDGKKFIDENIVALIEKKSNDEIISMLRKVDPNDTVASSGTTLLHLSVIHDNPLLTQFLIGWGVDMNAQDEDGDTPLMIAACIMELSYHAELLLDANADFKIKDLQSQSPLTVSIDQWHSTGPCRDVIEKIFEKLIKEQSSIEGIVEALVSAGCHLSDALFFKDPYSKEIIQYLLKTNYYQINSRGRCGNTILHIAAELEKIDFIKELLLLGADVTLENDLSCIPFISYINCTLNDQNQEIVKLLMPKNYDWTQGYACSQKKLKMRSVFMHGTEETLKVFKEHNSNADMTLKDGIGETPLHYLMKNHNKDILKLFEGFKFDINAHDNWLKKTAIHYAAGKGDFKDTQYLLNSGAELDHSDKHGNTPLMCAMSDLNNPLERKNIVQLLMLLGVDAQRINNRGQSAISIAAHHGAYTQVEPLLAHLAWLEINGVEIFPHIRGEIDHHEQIKTRFNTYKQQLEDMKTDYIWRTITAFDVLTGSDEKNSLCARWHNFTQRFIDQKFDYHSYFVALLQKRLAKAVEIRDLRRKVASILAEILLPFNLGYAVTSEVANYLNCDDLQKFFLSSK